uniref:Uncharacterized protein n=1 Tax=Arsenophonus nasoniae TaxID=638 RepID=D2U4J4_9GAMM|nr:hypothetical protein ARN_36130 [Arsenophonus nasoniae]
MMNIILISFQINIRANLCYVSLLTAVDWLYILTICLTSLFFPVCFGQLSWLFFYIL